MTQSDEIIQSRLREKLAQRYRTIDGQALRMLTEAGLTWLRTNSATVNAMNVFPVPDGDTGTNMMLTMQAAWKEIENSGDREVGKIAQAIANGALLGARGNSGVILSQIWRGFARALERVELLDCPALVKALHEARNTAYRGVVKPVEGTILTVTKDIAVAAKTGLEAGAHSVLDLLDVIVQSADESVENTPNLLPVLKEAGVVDSGGKGLYFILEGMLRAAYGLPLDQPLVSTLPLSALNLEGAEEAIEPGQDWEVIVDFRPDAPLSLPDFYKGLEDLGTSIQVGEGDGIYRMHIHVPDQTEYQPIDYIRNMGTITNIAIENLMVQMDEQRAARGIESIPLDPVEPGQIAVVVVTPGTGIARIFASLGASHIIEGGQTMNPSTEEILTALETLPTENVILLPNNKNIIMAAQQAAELTVKNAVVVRSISVPQGIAAMLNLVSDGDLDEVVAAMQDSLTDVCTGELTTATRSVVIDEVEVKEGQVIGLLDDHLVVAVDQLDEALLQLLQEARTDQAELITIYYGADMTAKQANQLADKVRETWPEHEVEVAEGGQPHYQLIVSIE